MFLTQAVKSRHFRTDIYIKKKKKAKTDRKKLIVRALREKPTLKDSAVTSVHAIIKGLPDFMGTVVCLFTGCANNNASFAINRVHTGRWWVGGVGGRWQLWGLLSLIWLNFGFTEVVP